MSRTAATDRAAIKRYLTACTDYDPATLRIRDDVVTAIRDADRTFRAPETVRVSLGYVEDVLTLADAALCN